MATSSLHNFVILEDTDIDVDSIHIAPGSPLNWGYCPTTERLDPITGTSQVQDINVRQVVRHGFTRPLHNIEWRRAELHEIGLM